MGLRVVIHSRKGFTEDQAKRHDEICRKVELVLNSVEFRNAVIAMRFTNTNGYNSLQIYQLIMCGAEILSPDVDNEIDLMVELYHKNNSTIGYTYPNTPWTWLNNKFYSKFSQAEAAGNLVHEWLHKLGFGHDSAKEHTSVPYAIGYLVRDMVRQMESRWYMPLQLVDEEFKTLPVKQKKYVCRRSWRTLFRKVCRYEYKL